MTYPLQWIRSALFALVMYGAMPLFGIVFLIPALIDRGWASRGAQLYSRWVRWLAAWMVGLKTEVRGTVPEGEVMVASKHQSFLDILMLVSVLERPKFIMKRSLTWAPVLGWYALRIGCVPVDRGKRGQAIRKMLEDVEKGAADPGQLVIYPQGTRVAPRADMPYKVGAAVLYEELGQPCVPAATNVGLFWPRLGIYRTPGLGVLEFLPALPPGLPRAEMLERLKTEVEAASDRLMDEAEASA